MRKFIMSAIALFLLSPVLTYAVDTKELKEVIVTGDSENIQTKKVGQTKKTAKSLNKEQVSDTKDLVRYETGVSVVENGRFGNSGYSIRGVDENRVAIMIDGLHQAETLSSQGFKELFEGYGNFNNTRNGVEVETLKEAVIRKGADSIKTGSGSLGGSVSFETKDARDFLLDKDYYYSYKTGYSTADNQILNAHTIAGRYKWFDLLFIKAKRNGHELENYDYKNVDGKIQGKRREKTDPYNIEKDSTLVKFSFQPSDEHRFTITSDNYKNTAKGHDLSYNLRFSKFFEPDEKESRHTNDQNKRKNLSFAYENYSQTPIWDTFKITYSDQKIKTRARTDEYCHGNNCDELKNSIGLQLKDGKVVDKYGKNFTIEEDPSGYKSTLIDSEGKRYDSDFKHYNPRETFIDCSKMDCSKKFTVWNRKNKQFEERNIIKKKHANGTEYGQIEQKQGEEYWDWIKNSLILPSNKGYLEDLWKERDLNTNTKQLNLDFTKELKILNAEHSFSYGGLYAKSKKSMVNKAGYFAQNIQWWNSYFFGGDNSGLSYVPDKCYSIEGAKLCPQNDPEFSFLIPVKTKAGALYFTDEFQINDYIGFDLGYRYDSVKYRPKYIPGTTPKIPDDIVKGLFIPLPKGPEITWNPGHFYPPTQEQIRKNAEENIAYISTPKNFKNHSYSFTTNIDPFTFMRLQMKYSKGFRAPTVDEMYFTFKHPDFTIFPNVNIKPEIANTKEIALTFYNDQSFITTSVFETRYKNFIDLIFLGTRNYQIANGGNSKDFYVYQNINRQNAWVKGFEVNSKLYLGQLTDILDGFNLGYKLTYQRGRIQGDIPMNAIQPKKYVYSIGYGSKKDTFGADLYITKVGAKKAKDTYNMFYEEQNQKDSTIKWRSDSYTLVDLITYVRPIKNLTIRAGVYNLTNRKYITWESARSIKPFGTSNLIDQKTGEGINRFYSAGRNYKINAEFVF